MQKADGQTHLIQNLSFSYEAYCGVKQRCDGGARAAEKAMLWHQVLICIHSVLHSIPTDQAAVQFSVCGTRQVHAVIALE